MNVNNSGLYVSTVVRVVLVLGSGFIAKYGIEQAQAESWLTAIGTGLVAIITTTIAIVSAMKHNKKLADSLPTESGK